MIRMARLANYSALGLAISSFIGLMAKHLAPFGVGTMVVCLLLFAGLAICLLMGNVLDNYFGWEPDTALAIAIGTLILFMLGGLIGWSIAQP